MSVLARESDDEFLVHAEPHRRELLAHCYRMTGSLHDAEDLVQETYLRAWKAYSGFQGKSSASSRGYTGSRRTPASRRFRADSDGRCPAAWAPRAPGRPTNCSSATRCRGLSRCRIPTTTRPIHRSSSAAVESVRLAFIAALQHLSPRQRAVLVLRDVLQWKAAEVADAIGASTAAVNSLLQRARAQLDAVGPSADDALAAVDSPETKDRLARYIAAFENYDIDSLEKMFTAEAVWEMPPFDGWYRGPQAIGSMIHLQCPARAPSTCGLSRSWPTASPPPR